MKAAISKYAVAALAALTLFSNSTWSQTTPILQAGKKSLFERVLTTPECRLHDKPAEAASKPVPAFSRFYLYEKANINGVPWVKVGPDTKGTIAGWLPQRCTVEWKMQLTLAFTNPANREPVLFFKDKQTAENLVNAEMPSKLIAPLLDDLKATGKAPGVVAKEPELAVDQKKNFYLLPIFSAEELYTQSGEPVRVLNVASVSKAEPNTDKKTAESSSENSKGSLKAFSAAVVFVIDSTISMGPYIERTRQAVRAITKDVDAAGLGDRVRFGLVAYRGNTQAVPQLEYVSKLFVDPTTVKSGADFLQKIESLAAAKVSTIGFNEDAYAGLSTALTDIDWNQFGARYIVLITDAGAIPGSDDLSTTKTDAAQVRLTAREKGVAIYVLHLKTPAGRRNHQQALGQYEDLAFNTVVSKPLYYPVDAGSVDDFGKMVDALSQSIVQQAKLAYEGQMAIGSALVAAPPSKADEKKDTVDELKRDAQLMGYAMQLAYLGEKQGTQAPSVFKAWVMDRDLTNPARASTDVRVLLTKNQLSDLSTTVKTILDAANQSHISPGIMFDQLRSVAATMGRDPNQLNQQKQSKLAELGLLGEYIQDLPYRSDVLNLDEQTWKSWSAAQQQQFIRNLNSKLSLYRTFNADLDRWVSLAPGADPGENVYPVPLEALP